jgi:hypothetical protein
LPRLKAMQGLEGVARSLRELIGLEDDSDSASLEESMLVSRPARAMPLSLAS